MGTIDPSRRNLGFQIGSTRGRPQPSQADETPAKRGTFQSGAHRSNRVATRSFVLGGSRATKTESVQTTPVKSAAIFSGKTPKQHLPESLATAKTIEQSNASGENLINDVLQGDLDKSNQTQAQLEELKQSVHEGDPNKFKSLVQSAGSDRSQLINDLLISYTAKGDTESYESTVNTLREMYPNIEKLIEDRPESGRVITCKGLNMVFDQLKAKKPWILDTSIINKGKQFKAKFDEINNSTGDLKSMIIWDDGVHFRPIYVEKKEGKIQVLFTDSLGDADTRVGGFSAEDIIKAIPTATVYSLSTIRQSDVTSCPVFSLRDAIQLSRFQDQDNDIFEFAKKNIESKHSDQDIVINKLPLEMMKTTQSISKLSRDYPEVRSSLEGKYIKNITVNGERKLGNTYTKEKFLKYERLLLAAAIREEISQENV